jgi:EAL domain-containing protein (putative c-di-GMP-specific phosphodiesterase class I)
MPCQHTLFGSVENRPVPPQEDLQERFQPIQFQPIIDTFEHRILAHECLPHSPPGGAGTLWHLALRSAARQPNPGLYFLNLVPSSLDDADFDTFRTDQALWNSWMQAPDVVFEVAESDLARNPAHSHQVRKFLRKSGFGFALSGTGVGAGDPFQAVTDFEPEYIVLDKRLTRNIDRPACAATISKMVQIAEGSGASVIAAGVDRVRTVEDLWLLGVRFMQGQLFGEPSPRSA